MRRNDNEQKKRTEAQHEEDVKCNIDNNWCDELNNDGVTVK